MSESKERMEAHIRAHLAAAYNYARWLVRSDRDAEDIVQEACARAWKYAASFRGENFRSWFMSTVRRTAFTWLSKNRNHQVMPMSEDFEIEDVKSPIIETLALKEALLKLAPEFVEVLVLKEIEGYSYEEMAKVIGIPVGTVMSRLSRARSKVLEVLSGLR